MADGEGDDFRGVVGVAGADGGFEGRVAVGGGFDQERDFAGGFDSALPAIDRLDAGQDIDAGSEFFFDERQRDGVGDGFIRAIGDDQQGFHGVRLT